MLSINTNLSSFIAQNSLKASSSKLNQAIERMTTGCKINHSKDNAANYSIATNMLTNIGAYQVAEGNVLQGLDMINTASENLTLIEDKLVKLRALATQASNGTYGVQSLEAIKVEAKTHIDEIERLYSTTEYNGIDLLNNYEARPPSSLEYLKSNSEYKNFIEPPCDYTDDDIKAMTKLSSIRSTDSISSGLYSISTMAELIQLSEMTNNGLISGGEFVLANDIDMSLCTNWLGIGTSTNRFVADFNGNGHVIKNLNSNQKGLFAYTKNSEIKNLGIINCNISGTTMVGALIGMAQTTQIENVYSTGVISCTSNYGGGLVGYYENGTITNSYSKSTVEGNTNTGGLIGYSQCNLSKCFFEGDIISNGHTVGGLVGANTTSISDCYSIANIKGSWMLGGLVGLQYVTSSTKNVDNCHFYGNVNGTLNSYSYGALIGGVSITSDEITYGNLNLNNVSANSNQSGIGAAFKSGFTYLTNYDTTAWNEIVKEASLSGVIMNLQVGINNFKSSNIHINTNLNYKSLDELLSLDITDSSALSILDNLLNQVSSKQTEYGAAQNRLESALDEISTQYENLVSSCSTICDVDIAEVSSDYIRQQILQQASATLMSTANQSPSIALQLI